MIKWTTFVVTVAMIAGGVAQAATIDNFNFGNVDFVGPGINSEGAVSGTLGGNRFTQLSVSGSAVRVNDPPPPTGDTTGLLSFSNDIGVASILTLDYVAVTPVDLTEGGTRNGIVFDFLSADQPVNVRLILISGINSFDETLAYGGGPGQLVFMMSDFTSNGVNMTGITEAIVQMTPNNNFGGDYLVDMIESRTIPTPAALPAGLALLGAFALRRRVR